MEIKTEDYEKLGAFYLGREYDLGSGQLKDDLVLYDSRDLVTHGVVLGMTGSGKTGLCLALLEEAAMDGVPAIAIDPKGDIANLLLAFPEFRASDFRPWIDPDEARRRGEAPDAFAATQAATWKGGLASWGQGGARVRAFRDRVETSVYTPGSSAGLPVSILSSLEAPPPAVADDPELFGERIESTVSSLLGLLGIDADPIRSREHILLSTVFQYAWSAGQNLSLAALVQRIQDPPFTQVGVVDIESFFGQGDRQALAMQLNNLLAAPGFAAWREGEGLDIQRLLFTPEGKPRISIFSVAHLSDHERMFFVSLLFNQVLAWMRGQPGTGSLRALLYMDEVYGYLPPTANPPSKKPLMTLLKQARAYGVGVLLATQNPVDLDYKALSNTGTWFLGRLQTERDKARVLDGLAGVAAGAGGKAFDRQAVGEVLSGLTSRVFLMNNVHEDAQVVFQVRWVMSYLRGPMTREQIRTLMAPQRERWASASAGEASPHAPEPAAAAAPRPALPRGVDEFFIRAKAPVSDAVYVPALLCAGEAIIDHRKSGAKGVKRAAFVNRFGPGSSPLDWGAREALEGGLAEVSRDPEFERAAYHSVPPAAVKKETYRRARKELEAWFYREGGATVWHSPDLDRYSKPDEPEAGFRARLALAAREERDARVDGLRATFQEKLDALEKKAARAAGKLEKEQAQAKAARLDSFMSIGSTVLGALLGRKKLSVTTIDRGRSAARGASRAWREGRDVEGARGVLEQLEEERAELEARCAEEVAELEDRLDPAALELEAIGVRPFKKDISVTAVGLAWLPFRAREGDTLEAAF